MQITTYNPQTIRPAADQHRPITRRTDWAVMSNDELIFALDILSLHYSPFEVDCMNEIERRIDRGAWIDIDQPVPVIAPTVPALFYVWPFSLLWSQRSRR